MTSVLASPERETDKRASKDLPHLSLSLDSPPSSSPFPSPSSSFLPPPMPGAHEFANKLPIPVSKKKQRDSTESSASVATAPAASAPVGANGTVTPPAQSSLERRLSLINSTLGSDGFRGGERRSSIHAKHASLSSSRRAPPSPSVSRRTSGAHNNSVALSRAPSNATTTARRRSRNVKIRDFAYPASDARHIGQGPDAPRPGRSRAPSEYDDMMGSSSRRNSGWGAFRWAGSKLWGFALGGGKQRSSTDEDGFVPTSSDFARNFDASSPNDELPSLGFSGDGNDESEEDDDEEDGEEGYPDQDVPLLPGLYRAMYAFLPEGTAEMALAEDQVVRIIGRGGGVGWAVAEDESGNHALVPESYLEAVQLDESPADLDSN